jgi:peptide/nickel transport system substrate-binding protein
MDDKMKPIPGLAERWERTGDLTWRIYLRKDVKFHNGEEMDAESVAFTVQAYKDSKGAAAAPWMAVKEAKAVDKYTAEFTTDKPNATLGDMMTFLFIFPKEYYRKLGPEQFGLKPVGTGPFEFVEWVKGSQITVKRNRNYWKGAPKLSGITFRWAPEASSRVAMLETGQADLIVNVPIQMVSRIQAAGARVETVRGIRKLFVEFNLFRPPFKDVRLRKAVAHAIDVDELLRTVLKDLGVRSPGINATYLPSWDPNFVPTYDYSPDKAKKLMAAAGSPNGFTTDFYHTVGRYPMDKELAEAIAFQLAKVGIKCNIKGMETGAYFELLSTAVDGVGKMEGMHLLSLAPLFPHEDFAMRDAFYSKGHYHYASSPQGDRMIEEAAAISDPAKRLAAYKALEKYILEELVSWVPLYDQIDQYGVSKRLQWKPRPDEILDFRAASVE